MPTVAATCPYVPLEWIDAHGLTPKRVMPSTSRRGEFMRATAGLCAYARAYMNTLAAAPRADAAVFTTVCDQMRRAAEVFADQAHLPTFVMNVPATWQTPASQRLYADELRRLGRFLVSLGGETPSDETLTGVMRQHEAARTRLYDARNALHAREYVQAWGEFDPAADLPFAQPHEASSLDAVPLALVGGPVLLEQLDVFDLVEQYGGRVVLAAVEGGEMSSPAPFDADALAEDPLAELARAYHGTIPHPMRRPDTQLHQWIEREITLAAPRGILFQRYLWCDLWHGELARIRQWSSVPVLDVSIGDEDDSYCLSGRIQAFIETLQ